MTVITVRSPLGRIDLAQRRVLAEQLTDAVLVPEVGQPSEVARVGFQVHFLDLDPTQMAIGGQLLSDVERDVLLVDIAVMDGAWPTEVRRTVIQRTLAALAAAAGQNAPAPNWWVNFRVIDEGSWGAYGDVVSILDLAESAAFTEARREAIRAAIDTDPKQR